jgi:hypothetical protein
LIKAFINQHVFFLKLKKKKILFFGSHIHRVIQNGNYFNRFYDSIVEHYNLVDDVYMVEYQRVYENTYNKQVVISLIKHLNDYKLIQKIKNRTKRMNTKVCLPDYELFLKELKNINIDAQNINITKTDLIKWGNKIRDLQPFFTKFYKITKPKKVVFLGYYGYDDLYAALTTANQMNIETVDFQHGPQTKVHMAYSDWLKVPKTGFNTMPITFWNWDSESKENIESWSKKTNNVKSILFGQPYVIYWLKNNKLKNNAGKNILYSMQTSPLDLMTKKLISVIKDSNYKWVLRLHPRNKTTVLEIEEFLKINKIDSKTTIQDPTWKPLPEALSNSIIHVTNYSGCVIEAQMMGIPSILIHQIGLEMFEKYLNNNVYYLNQKENNFELNFKELALNLENIESKLNNPEIGNPLD